MSLVDAISPIAPATGQQNRATIDKTTSTPNNPQFLDSFAKLFESPAASPTVAPSSFQFRQIQSPLATSIAPKLLPRPEQLNGIREVSETEHPSITREDLNNLKEEILQSFRNETNAMQQQLMEFEKRMQADLERNRFAIIRCIKEIEDLRNVVRLEQIVNEVLDREGNLSLK